MQTEGEILYVRLSPEDAKRLGILLEKERARRPYAKVSKSDLVRQIIGERLEAAR